MSWFSRTIACKYRSGRFRSPASAIFLPMMGDPALTRILISYSRLYRSSWWGGVRSGSSHFEVNRMNSVPKIATGTPIQAVPHMATLPLGPESPSCTAQSGGCCHHSMKSPMIMRFEPVPIIVPCPPRIAPNESGMRSFDTGILSLFAQSETIGRYIATIGVVFMNADIPATGIIIRA